MTSFVRRHRRQQADAPRWHPRAAGSLALWQLGGEIALFLPTYNTRGWYLPGGALERDEDPEHALSRELLEETGLRREPLRLLVIESVRADPARGKPAGENYIWQVEPLTHQEWDNIRLPPEELKDKRLVAPNDLGRFVLPTLERRIHMALKAQAAGTTLYLPPSH
ncbi:NUDIX domain-containing protein [Actinacidiphila sp. ITFR-21]|uniref:NUDIX domain-containing protein n=1 Tax=Actinacidiphila sp. ITFR-21 TaxID=3075199 RepID=UPI00288A43A1|nr:NUDIX domain-containing protein [Streptomyces sp. ITFR-21]WNI20068.1 NUDIX domain-containing protein [Streptomyces sp. ITFR-21]